MTNLVKSKTASGDKNRWATTWDCFTTAEGLFGRMFQLDVCAEPQTAKAPMYYITPDWQMDLGALRGSASTCIGFDALQCAWANDFWCNPPFDLKREFIEAAREASNYGLSGMMLLPYEPCTKWFRELVMPYDDTVYVPDGRYNFLETDGVTKKSGVNFPSCFVLWTPHHNGGRARIVDIER